MNFNLVEMYNGLLRFNKHILNELAEGLKHLPNLDGVSKGDSLITEFDFRFGPYFIPNKVGTNKKADYNWIRGNNGQDTDKAVCVLLLGGTANSGSRAGSGRFDPHWVRSVSDAYVGFFTTVKLD
nr:MAG: hypothetical protein [Bacteriophage sp.]